MTCHDLAERIAAVRPELTPASVARLCLLILSQCDDSDELAGDAALRRHWNHASFRLQAAADQHAAVAEELKAMCREHPASLSPEQVGTLLRSVKVQSQVLDLYLEQPALA